MPTTPAARTDPPPADTGPNLAALEVRRLGRVPYSAALALQQELVADRQADRVPDTLLLLEHPHVVTLGASARRQLTNVLASPRELGDRGVELHEAPRGGDVTYHGPGQLVGYPILDLRPDRCDVHRYVRDLESVLIATARAFGIAAERCAGLTGVWVGNAKLAAIGVRLSRWVTSHGFALNVATDLGYFGLIRPCGIQGRGVTSLTALAGRAVSVAEVEPLLVREFGAKFDRAPRQWRSAG